MTGERGNHCERMIHFPRREQEQGSPNQPKRTQSESVHLNTFLWIIAIHKSLNLKCLSRQLCPTYIINITFTANMKLSQFMVPADQVVTVACTDTLQDAMDLMLEHKIGAVLVLEAGLTRKPAGIVTKSDFLKAFHNNLSLDHSCAEIMSRHLITCSANSDRSKAAQILEESKHHHLIIVDNDGNFSGLVSTWGVTVECANEAQCTVWPWLRNPQGKAASGRKRLPGESFRIYLVNLGFDDHDLGYVSDGYLNKFV